MYINEELLLFLTLKMQFIQLSLNEPAVFILNKLYYF